MQRIDEHIRSGQFAPLYFLYGEEAYLRNLYKRRLASALEQAFGEMNITRFDGRDTAPGQVMDLADTMPFLASGRAIILQDTGWAKAGGGDMAAYLERLPESVVLVFCEREVDKRSRFFRSAAKVGMAVVFEAKPREWVEHFALSKLKKQGLAIRRSTMELLLSKTGLDLATVDMEVRKLCDYCLGQNAVEEADVEAICARTVQNRIFAMLEEVWDGRRGEALSMYRDLLFLKEQPLGILALLTRQCRYFLAARELAAKGYGKQAIAKELGIQPFMAGRVMERAARWNMSRLLEALQMCVQTEMDIKMGLMEGALAVELLLARIFGRPEEGLWEL